MLVSVLKLRIFSAIISWILVHLLKVYNKNKNESKSKIFFVKLAFSYKIL
jgi:hypothetical protein